MTVERRVNLLVAVLGVVLIVTLRPVTTELAAGGPSVECDVASFVVGEHDRAVTEACREAFRGRASAALIVLAGIAALAAQLVHGDRARREVVDVDVDPSLRSPGEDPSIVGGLAGAARTPSFRLLAGLAMALIVVLLVVLRPVDVGSQACGLDEHVFGARDAVATATCRDAYAGRAFAGLLVLAALGVAVSMLTWIVQYHRGAALGTVWHRTGLPRAVLARVAGTCAALSVIAVLVSSGTSRPAVAAADPVASDAVAPTNVTMTSTTDPPTPLEVRDASWFAANPNPFDASTVPEGTLPVGAVAGEDDVHAFFRVIGTESTLLLVESDAPGAQRLPEQAVVRACPVTVDGWEQTSGGSFADEPAYDADACVDVARRPDGEWSIDVGALDDGAALRGIALVPAEGASTFRLTLEAPTRGDCCA